MPAYPKGIIKDNFVQELKSQIISFKEFECGGKTDLCFHLEQN